MAPLAALEGTEKLGSKVALWVPKLRRPGHTGTPKKCGCFLIFGTLIWVNYNELTTSSLEIIVSKGNHPQMALIQVSELL